MAADRRKDEICHFTSFRIFHLHHCFLRSLIPLRHHQRPRNITKYRWWLAGCKVDAQMTDTQTQQTVIFFAHAPYLLSFFRYPKQTKAQAATSRFQILYHLSSTWGNVSSAASYHHYSPPIKHTQTQTAKNRDQSESLKTNKNNSIVIILIIGHCCCDIAFPPVLLTAKKKTPQDDG